MEWKESRSKATKHKDTALRNFTQRDIEVLTDVYAVLQEVYDEEAQTYFRRYINAPRIAQGGDSSDNPIAESLFRLSRLTNFDFVITENGWDDKIYALL